MNIESVMRNGKLESFQVTNPRKPKFTKGQVVKTGKMILCRSYAQIVGYRYYWLMDEAGIEYLVDGNDEWIMEKHLSPVGFWRSVWEKIKMTLK